MRYPISPKETLRGLLYFPRLCDKVRLHQKGELAEDYHQNLGAGMDLWACQLLKVEYAQLAEQIQQGCSDEQALEWAFKEGCEPSETCLDWWNSYMRNCGFRDALAEILAERIEADAYQGRGILTFFDYIDVDEDR